MDYWDVERPFTDENFNEAAYLLANPDVASAISAGWLASGREHFSRSGRTEKRAFRDASGIGPLRAEKMARLTPLLELGRQHEKHGLKYDFLTPEVRAETGIVGTEKISSNGYDAFATELIDSNLDGLVLDCGAGRRARYYKNVVNYEIVDYDTTDIIGVGEQLPSRTTASMV